jgi:predicted flap endonuclease-1-like 5' DNA nuclease
MSYLLAQILVCLLIAGLIGAVIGWLLRGGCSQKLRDCEEEWKMKIGSLESEWNSKLHRTTTKEVDEKEMQEATLKRHAEHVASQTPSYSYEQELKEKLERAQQAKKEHKEEHNENQTVASAGIAAAGIAAGSLSKEASIDTDIPHLQESYELHTLDNLAPQHSEKLNELGIHATKDLTNLHQDKEAIKKVAGALDVDDDTVASWIGKSCLLTLPGVDSKTAELIQNAGITSMDEIATSSPENLHKKMADFNKEALIPTDLPDIKAISLWSKVAKPFSIKKESEPDSSAVLHLVSSDTAPQVADTSAYEKELKEKLGIPVQEDTNREESFDLDAIKNILASRHISLSPEKIALYAANGIDFEKGEHLEDNYDIQQIEGVGPKYASIFKEMGIATTQALVTKLHKHHDKLDQVAKALQIQPETLSSWISMADLMQLPGVDGQAAELMQTVGIASTKELAITNANSLYNEMVAFNKKSPIAPEVPTEESLTLWSKIAKELAI